MPIVSIHDLPQINSTTISDDAELMVNNSGSQTVQANRISKAEFLKKITAKIADLDGDIASVQANLEAHTYLTSIQGYDATKTQVLKNVNGTLQWVEEI